ncbi:uncharacterized protein N7529_007196 [Penicillium soppii]|uniref:uncharacterized protein n=1 Tax=Penicillium soppii TaxID=69789 RepID=UPI0025490492|nr:uncharacterized protein N7529_007196 [Penicillium soppii]KAJ5865280.1 hypothetical protein N7529_007196 [Penicillium soppii]
MGLGSVQGLLIPHCTGNSLACVANILIGINPPFISRLADCSSYQKVVVTPSPTTVSTTVATTTITVTTTLGAVMRRAEVNALQATSTPTSVPTYLGPQCTQPGIYGSACACLGIPRTTSTAPTPTVTTSVTATTTTTVTVTPVPTSCVGQTCGSYTFSPCPEGTCACGLDPDNNSFCFVGGACILACTTNSDCAAGSKCLVGSCCGTPICQVESSSTCSNVALQLQGAAAVAADATSCTSVSCPNQDELD